jgi:Flp pilus assembly protein TadB
VTWLAAVAAAAAIVLARPPRPAWRSRRAPRVAPGRGDWMTRGRWPLSLLAGVAAALFVGGPVAPVAGLAGAGATWWCVGRSEPASSRRHREQVARDLPHLVHLMAAALASGAPPADAVRLVDAALPGPASARLRPVAEQLALGADPVRVWATLGEDDALAPLGRALARAHQTGAPVVAAVDRLGGELAREARASVEDRARTVGVKAALPLGLCLLPAFLLVGIVPLVAGLVGGLTSS